MTKDSLQHSDLGSGDMKSLDDYLTELVTNDMPTRCIKIPELEFYTAPKIVRYLRKNLQKHRINEASWAVSQASADNGSAPEMKRLIAKVFQYSCKYSIFSHTWLRHEQDGEIDFKDAVCDPNSLKDSLIRYSETKRLSFLKLQGFFKISDEAKVSFAWADTLCIDKDPLVTPQEVSICIPRMFQWYSRSAICIVYLANSNRIEDIRDDPWFTRGLTLQELLAPRNMMFYGSEWQCFGGYRKDKERDRSVSLGGDDISTQVTLASGMRREDLLTFREGKERASIPARMKWMLSRKTTVPQDRFYALVGIFHIHKMDVHYEDDSDRTFFNLLRAILKNEQYANNLSIFNYAGRSIDSSIATTSILPSCLECYKDASMSLKEINDMRHKLRYDLRPEGLAINVVLAFGVPVDCPNDDMRPFKFTLVQNTHNTGRIWSRKPFAFELLNETEEDKKKVLRFKQSNCAVFAIWTFEDAGDYVCFPPSCSAFLLGVTLTERMCEDGVSAMNFPKNLITRSAKVDTVKPIVFKRRRYEPKVIAPTAVVGPNIDGQITGNVGISAAYENDRIQSLQSRQPRDARLRIKKDHLFLHNMSHMSTYL